MTDATPPREELHDGALHDEIELVGELVVAAASCSGPMSEAEIDRILGVDPSGKPRNPAGSAA